MTDWTIVILAISFFVIAFFYASVGFGGGSSYLALLAVMAVPFEMIRTTALICNIVVVTGGTYIFFKEGKLDLKKDWPFLVASVPLAFLGGYWKLDETSFFVLLGGLLVIASFLLWFQAQRPLMTNRAPWLAAVLGGGIGFLSGLVSIGGGIFLSPLLHLIRWDDAKKISALASAFILVNSVSGLAGHAARSASVPWALVLPLMAAVLLGGQIGSRLGARKFNALYIKRITAVLILLAGINILKDHL